MISSAVTTDMLPCCLGALERPRYFPRQLITPTELNLEAEYFAERLRRHNRMLHGFGVVCGAKVCRVPAVDGDGAEPWKVKVTPGYAIDGCGNEIAIDCDRVIDLRSGGVVATCGDPAGELSDPWCCDSWTDRLPETVWISVCHKETLSRPVSVQPVGCGCEDTSCEYSRWRDGYEIRVLSKRPDSCDAKPPTSEEFMAAFTGPLRECPPSPDDPCVVLAQIDLDADGTITAIDSCSCRRNIVSLAPLWWQCVGEALSIRRVQRRRNFRADSTDTLVLSGHNFRAGIEADLGPGIGVTVTDVTPTKLTLHLDIAADAEIGDRAVMVTNPDLSVATLEKAITVKAAS